MFSTAFSAVNLTDEEQLAEWQKVVAEMEAENQTEKWIYFFNTVKQKIEKFFNYNDEFDSTSTPKITNDWRTAIYSIWNEIFLKNSNEIISWNSTEIWVLDFWEISVNENSVKLFKTSVEWETLILTWKDEEKFDWYLIQIKSSIDWFLDSDTKSLVYILKKVDEDWQAKFEIWDDLKNNAKIFLTEKNFSSPELKIFFNDENFFYAKIFWIKDWKLSTASAQKIMYWNTKNLPPKKISTIEKVSYPILVENFLKISDLELTNFDEWDTFAWDFDWNDVFEKSWESVLLPVQQDTWSFFVNLQITKKTGEKFIKKIQINFFSPKIFLDSEQDWKIFWHIEPRIKNFPVSYIYENEENPQKFWEEILTDDLWNFSFLKKSQKKSRKIFLSDKKILWEIFTQSGSVQLVFSEQKWNFLTVFNQTENWKEIIWIFYANWEIQIFDKRYVISIVNWEKNEFYLMRDWKKEFYFNFWIIK